MADLGTLDLNLLRVFDAVARERHVTRAAERLHLSQPAVSNALARLRAALGDELFLRRPGGVEPTALALSLAGPVAEALDRIAGAILAQAPFDPATTDRVFPIAFSEYAEAVLAPPLIARMQLEAPGAMLAIRHADRTNWEALLAEGQAVLALGMLPDPPALYTRLRLLPEVFCTVMRAGHPLAEGELTLERFLSVPHLLHSPNGSRDGALDGMLARTGHKRRLGAVVAHLAGVPEILRGTDLVMTLSARLAQLLAEAHGLVVRPTPVAIRHSRLSLVFHRRCEADAGHAWLRRLILGVAREITPVGAPPEDAPEEEDA
ncbi:LysR family transcriptional regulator [Siccirubricoccus sp. KC 17139]|uniref:LysR family transcriptional regulator n=1 Tax=Siccirubricoccus soli TaxID=2899147 RepID=A0ABT1CZW3_9PROT|nr:LysR family transcriptional regulator [Siccirubricoccus soli]MCO6414962.1 LysR family transcriptional regulator [Siccirubricoccus soli]MCP2681093.1 LysR family transcriptional regulator [Siccirubricoccus soli]